jgi:hypothetical protein
VGNKKNRTPYFLEFLNAVNALLLKALIANGEHFVNYQNVRTHADCNGERQADIHSTRIELHLRINELFNFTEGNNLVEDAVDHLAREAEHCSVEIHVVATRQLALESSTELKQCRKASTKSDLA